VRLRDRWAAEAERLLVRRRAVLALDGDRLEVAVVSAVCRAAGVLRAELLLVVGLAALDREAVALESRAARVVAAREPPLWAPREPLLCDPLGLAPFRRDRLDAARRLRGLFDVVELSAMTLLR
jgi:hypothetical protein